MWIRLRQIALVCEDLLTTSLDIGLVLGLEPCFTDPGVKIFGLKNLLWPIGSQFLEVVTPIEPGTAGDRYRQRRNGDTGYMVITEVDDIARRRERADELGIRIAFNLTDLDASSGFRHDGVQLHPADTGGALLEMDQMIIGDGPEGSDGHGENAVGGPWYPAGKNWKPYVRTDQVSAIVAAELQTPEPNRLADRWGAMTELPVQDDGSGRFSIEFENAIIRFVPAVDGRGEGLGAIDVTTVDRDAVLSAARSRGCYLNDHQVTIGGLRINLM